MGRAGWIDLQTMGRGEENYLWQHPTGNETLGCGDWVCWVMVGSASSLELATSLAGTQRVSWQMIRWWLSS